MPRTYKTRAVVFNGKPAQMIRFGDRALIRANGLETFWEPVADIRAALRNKVAARSPLSLQGRLESVVNPPQAVSGAGFMRVKVSSRVKFNIPVRATLLDGRMSLSVMVDGYAYPSGFHDRKDQAEQDVREYLRSLDMAVLNRLGSRVQKGDPLPPDYMAALHDAEAAALAAVKEHTQSAQLKEEMQTICL